MKALQKLTKGKKYAIFLDFEGTQFSHEIIAIGAVKCKLKENGELMKQKKKETFKVYVKCLGQIGKIVVKLTSITEDILKTEGVTLEKALDQFSKFVGVNFYECVFFAFGSNDVKMMIDSISYSKPSNAEIGYVMCRNTVDYLAFITQYCKDERGNNYSLTSYLKLFKGEPAGISHDPLNDAIDLMNLYRGVYTQKTILKEEYIKVLSHQRSLPEPLSKVVNELLEGKAVTPKKFDKTVREFLE